MSEAIKSAVEAAVQSEVLSKNPAEMSISDVTFAYAAITHLETVLKARKEQLRTVLLEYAQDHGKPVGEKGAVEVVVAGSKVTKERKTATTPDVEKLKVKVKEKGLGVEAAFDELTVLEYNPSKVQFLVDTGKLDGAEVEALRPVSYSLRVTPSASVKKVLNEAAPLPKPE